MKKMALIAMILTYALLLTGCLGGGNGSSPVASNVATEQVVASAGGNAANINEAIKQNAAGWVAEENPVSMSVNFASAPDAGSELLGCAPEFASVDSINRAPSFAGVTIPTKIDWKNKDGKNYITSVKHQGKHQTCVAFATIGALEAHRIMSGAAGSEPDYSELDLFYNGGGKFTYGWTITAAVTHLKNKGVVTESEAPYSMAPSFKLMTVKPTNTKIKEYSGFGGTDLMKNALARGPIVGSMDVYQDFYYYRSGIYQHVSGSKLGGHAVLLVGFDDSQNCWIAKNSWGASWGEKGFFRIKYGQCNIDKYACYSIYYENTSSNNTPTETVSPIPALAPPATVEIVKADDYSVELRWSAVEAVQLYNVYRNGRLAVKLDSSKTSFTIENVEPNYNHSVQVSAVRDGKESAKSAIKYARTLPLNVPQGLAVTLVTTSEVGLKWDAVKNVQGYYIYANGRYVAKVTANSHNFVKLYPNYSYNFQVMSFRGAYYSALSKAVLVKTEALPQKPVLSRIVCTMKNGKVSIVYDVKDADSQSVKVTMMYSTDNGRNFKPAATAAGDLSDTSTGLNKKVEWTPKNELPVNSYVRFKVNINDGYNSVDSYLYTSGYVK